MERVHAADLFFCGVEEVFESYPSSGMVEDRLSQQSPREVRQQTSVPNLLLT
jgi:hypothetical protein